MASTEACLIGLHSMTVPGKPLAIGIAGQRKPNPDIAFIFKRFLGNRLLFALHLLKVRPTFHFRGLISIFGPCDLSMAPSVQYLKHPKPMLTTAMLAQFIDAFFPNTTPEQCRHPLVFPFYADLKHYGGEGRLPLFLFECRTEDCLLENTMLMALRWQLAGGQWLNCILVHRMGSWRFRLRR